ncbi:thiamine pyrophosphate-dependent enzyme [Brevibacterium sp. RIT 803]|uniref:thiamine pyrophosphate-dependent enzyme n=1 Tax=Brevibacterium sp. RIT 803 TaxID=2810210 RepID=UPI00194E41D3|nr:thiamine pyrophosphate-dependent enzyme [Brevibacterium sp. RIT 803]MBM6592222.1 phosphonopyruvate decarboxylase [Brevibacterium sp. RIT 803]
MRRYQALQLINELTADLPLVVTCAATSRELAAVETRDNHFYVLDSMGLVGSIATGLAIAAKGSDVQKVIGLEGDGSLFMNPNVLPTGGFLSPNRLFLILLDNQVYGSTADIPTYADRVDLGAIAEASGWTVGRADDEASFRSEYARLLNTAGPTFLHMRIEPGNATDVPKLLVDPVTITNRFQAWFTHRLGQGTEVNA